MPSNANHCEEKKYPREQVSWAEFHFVHEDLILATTLLYAHLMDEKSEVMKRLKYLTQDHAFEKE